MYLDFWEHQDIPMPDYLIMKYKLHQFIYTKTELYEICKAYGHAHHIKTALLYQNNRYSVKIKKNNGTIKIMIGQKARYFHEILSYFALLPSE